MMATTPTPLTSLLGAFILPQSSSSSSRIRTHLPIWTHPTNIRHRHRSCSLLFCARSSSSSNQTAESDLCLCVGTHLIPHPNKVDKGGEDAYLVSTYNGGVIAVADGVSGWAEHNVDPSLFSRELMSNASSLLRVEELSYDPQLLLREAHAATSSVGSATVIIALLERGRILKIASVGDCGLRIIRKGKIVFSTTPQEHYFDCPYQLSSEAVGQTYLDAVVRPIAYGELRLPILPLGSFFSELNKQPNLLIVCEGKLVYYAILCTG